ncbi:MAG TPA: sulfurtransferase TusA family protein [Nitrospiria bacterium]|jgi:TusA-related sulfurtransferase
MTSTDELKPDKTLDCKGLSCPIPIVKTKLAVDSLQPGQILEMIATDKGSKPDMAAFIEETGNRLISSKEENGVFFYYIRKED